MRNQGDERVTYLLGVVNDLGLLRKEEVNGVWCSK